MQALRDMHDGSYPAYCVFTDRFVGTGLKSSFPSDVYSFGVVIW